jgi:hypothetical protein
LCLLENSSNNVSTTQLDRGLQGCSPPYHK